MITVQNNVVVKRTARYYTNGVNPENAESLWILLHGYGQLAGNFIRKFDVLDNGKNLLVAPEALSRLYLDNGFGKIGASWMTKEDRENEIEDYAFYLSEVYKSLQVSRGKTLPLNVFGFSQGTSTAARWLQKSGLKADKLVLWGGFFPPDFDLSKWNESFNTLLLITGTKDHFFTPELFADAKKMLEKNSVNYVYYLYEGAHEMKEEEVVKVFEKI